MKLDEAFSFRRSNRVDPAIKKIVKRDINEDMNISTASELLEMWDEMHKSLGEEAEKLNLFKAKDVMKLISKVTNHPSSNVSQYDLLNPDDGMEPEERKEVSLGAILEILYYTMKHIARISRFKQ